MAGLQEQVRQLEEVNEDMLEETTRYGDDRLRESTSIWADPQVRIVKMLSDVPLARASREKGSEEES